MECPACHHPNREGRSFCAQCGSALSVACAQCHFVNEPQDRFCGGCGTALRTLTPQDAGADPGRRDEAERRPLTIMFIDLVGSTEMSLRLDPEDLRELIIRFQQQSTQIVQEHDGFVARYMGDGILSYFGYPQAHEDDAERAVLAGLAVIEAIHSLDQDVGRARGARLQVRVGVASGLAVVGNLIGEGASQERPAVGETPNLAARMQGLAEPDTIVMDDATRRRVETAFDLQDLGLRDIKGSPEPVRAWRILKPRDAQRRFDSSLQADIGAMVGRDAELGQLRELWLRSARGEGQVVVLTGESGIGKTRLARAVYTDVVDAATPRTRYQCLPLYANSAFYPFAEQITASADVGPDEPADVRFSKLRTYLARFSQDTNTYHALFGRLLSIDAEGLFTELNMSAGELKQRTIAAFCEQIATLAHDTGALVLFEDMHWADPSSLELLDTLVARVESSSIMLICTQRPDHPLRWQSHSHVTSIELHRLNPAHSETLIAQHLEGLDVPPHVRSALLAKSDGVPLFVEELARTVETAVSESEAKAADSWDIAIPDTLQSSLMARLDRLHSARQVAQTGATIGRRFYYRLLAEVTELAGSELDASLNTLESEHLIDCQGHPPDSQHSFRHGLLRDAAYQSLLRSRRREIHERIAIALEQDFASEREAHPEILAHHLTEAGHHEKAIDYWEKAAHKAMQASAGIEAERHFGRALELLAEVPSGEARSHRELNLLTSMGAVLINNHGPGSSLVVDLYRRCKALCEGLGQAGDVRQPTEQFATLWGLWRTCESLNVAMDLVAQMQALGEQGHREDLILQAHHSGWATLFNLGRFTECLDSIDIGERLYDADAHSEHASMYGGHDPQVCAHGIGGVALCLRGFPQRGASRIEQAVALAENLEQPGSLAHALDFAATFERMCDDPERTLEHAQRLIHCAAEHGFADYDTRGRAFRGWALTRLGNAEEGLTELRASILAQRQTGTSEDFSFFLDMLADSYAAVGRPRDGLAAIEEALQDSVRNEAAFWSSATKICQARLIALDDDSRLAEAIACSREALEIAQRQQAHLLELNAALLFAGLTKQAGLEEDRRNIVERPYREVETVRSLRVLDEAQRFLAQPD